MQPPDQISLGDEDLSIDDIGPDFIGDYEENSNASDESVAELFQTTQKRMIAVQNRQRNELWQKE